DRPHTIVLYRGRRIILCSVEGVLSRAFRPRKHANKKGNTTMKRVLLIALMAGGLAFVPAQRSDAQVSVGIGVGYPRYGYYNGYGYYPYRYYRTYPYYGYYENYVYGGPRCYHQPRHMAVYCLYC